MQARLIFSDYLGNHFVPRLEALGFHGTDQIFRRQVDQVISVINIQDHRNGDRCGVQLGLHLAFLPASWARHCLSLEKLTAADCEFRWGLSPTRKQDYWWKYRTWLRSPARSARHLIDTYFAHGDPALSRFQRIEDFANLLRPEDFENGAWLTRADPVKPLRGALTMARIHLHLGDRATAKAYAQAGMSQIRRTMALVSEYESILRAA